MLTLFKVPNTGEPKQEDCLLVAMELIQGHEQELVLSHTIQYVSIFPTQCGSVHRVFGFFGIGIMEVGKDRFIKVIILEIDYPLCKI